jgi:hypothetical protein
MRTQIQITMNSLRVKTTVSKLEAYLQTASLTPQEVLAAVALLAAHQISVLPAETHDSAGDMFGSMIDIGLAL